MGIVAKFGAMAVLICGLVGCAETSGLDGALGIKTLPKGEPIGIRTLLAAHPGQAACTQYDQSSNSCASLITSRISGNTLISSEIAAVKDFETDVPQQIEVVTRSTLRDGKACVKAQDINVGPNSQDKDLAQFIVDVTRDFVAEIGEVCGSYFKAGDGYVVSSTGADGTPFPPGDTSFQYVMGSPSLRAQ